jgi:hypothetical protein
VRRGRPARRPFEHSTLSPNCARLKRIVRGALKNFQVRHMSFAIAIPLPVARKRLSRSTFALDEIAVNPDKAKWLIDLLGTNGGRVSGSRSTGD